MEIDEGGDPVKILSILEEYQLKVEEYKQDSLKSQLLLKQLQRENEEAMKQMKGDLNLMEMKENEVERLKR